jgi:hypothetical protein
MVVVLGATAVLVQAPVAVLAAAAAVRVDMLEMAVKALTLDVARALQVFLVLAALLAAAAAQQLAALLG